MGEDNLYNSNTIENVILIMTIMDEPAPELENRHIRIYIKPKDEKQKEVSIITIADFFKNLQILLYQVCDEIVENEVRKTGRYPNFIKDHCDLVLKNVVISSTDAIVGLGSSQTILPFPDVSNTIGEQAIAKTHKIFEIVQERDNIYPDLSPEISDKERRYRVLSAVDGIWPDENNRYEYNLAIGEKTLNKMNPKRKPKIREALKREPEPSEKTIFGRLVELDVTKKHSCQIETESGKIKCKYSPNLMSGIKGNIGEFIAVSGEMKNSTTITLTSEFAIRRIETIPIKHMILDEHLMELKKEVELSVNYDKEHENYIIDSNLFNVFSINNKLDLAIKDIKEQIGMLWKGFVKDDISNLSESAIGFRNLLIEIIGE